MMSFWSIGLLGLVFGTPAVSVEIIDYSGKQIVRPRPHSVSTTIHKHMQHQRMLNHMHSSTVGIIDDSKDGIIRHTVQGFGGFSKLGGLKRFQSKKDEVSKVKVKSSEKEDEDEQIHLSAHHKAKKKAKAKAAANAEADSQAITQEEVEEQTVAQAEEGAADEAVSAAVSATVGAAPAPGPAPVGGKPPVPMNTDGSAWYDRMDAEQDIASQGFQGEKTHHDDKETMIGDWQREFGPKQGGMQNFRKICAEKHNGKNTWCKRYGYHDPPKKKTTPKVKSGASSMWSISAAAVLLALGVQSA